MANEPPKNLLEKVFAPLQYDTRASAALANYLLTGKPIQQFWNEGGDYQQIVDEQFPNLPKGMRQAVGFGANVFLSPQTYTGIGALTKVGAGGKLARPLLSFAGKEIIKGAPVIKGAKSVIEAFLKTAPGEALGKMFGGSNFIRKLKYPEIESAFQARNAAAAAGTRVARKLEDDLVKLYSHGIDKPTEIVIRDAMEKMPRASEFERQTAENFLRKNHGEDAAAIYSMASVRKANLEERRKALGYLTPEMEKEMQARVGVAAHLPHIVTNYKKKDVIREMKLGGVDPRNISGLMRRKEPGTITEVVKRFEGKRTYEEYLPRIMGLSAQDMVHAEVDVNYLRAMAKAIGKTENPGNWIHPTLDTDTLGVLDKIFRQADGRPIFVPPELRSEVYKVANGVMKMDDMSTGLLGMYDWSLNWWRRNTLTLFPMYHIRNFFGNIWNNHLAGVSNPKYYLESGKLMWRMRNNKTLAEDLPMITDLMAHKIIGTGQYAGEFAINTSGAWKDAILKGDWVPYKLLGKNSTPMLAGRWVGEVTENHARIAHYLAKIAAGYSPVDAAASVKKYLFQYGKEFLSDFEWNVARRVAPFWTWTRNNLPLQLQTLIEKPGKIANLGKFIESVEGLMGPQPVETWMSEWMKKNEPVYLGAGKDGKPQYYLLGNWVPTADLVQLEHPIDQLVSMMSPIPKEFFQQYFNYDAYFQKPIERVPGELDNFLGVVMTRRISHLLANFRMLNTLDKLNPGGIFGKDRPHQVEQEEWKRWLNLGIGRLYPYDPEKARQIWMRDFSEAKSQLNSQIKYALRRGYTKEAVKYRQDLKTLIQEKTQAIRGE